MKNLWKYLSAVCLMFVAFLCLGIGLKTGEKAEAAKDYDVYVASGSSYTMSSGTINNGVSVEGTFTMNGGTIQHSGGYGVLSNGTFLMNNGTIQNCESAVVIGEQFSFTLKGGIVKGTGMTIDVGGDCIVYGGTISGGTIMCWYHGRMEYYGGKIESKIEIDYTDDNYLTLHKEPENTFEIEVGNIAVGEKIIKLDGISTIDLTKLNVTNLPADTQLEVQYVDGAYWVVVAEKTYTVTFRTNATITGGGWNISGGTGTTPYTQATSVTLHFTKGAKFTCAGYYYFTNCVEKYNYATTATPSGYHIDSVKASDGTVVGTSSYPYPASYEITGNTTITIYYKYTITFEAKTGGTVSKTSYDLNAGTSLKFTPNGASLSTGNGSAVYADFSGVTATPNSNTYFMYWQKDGTTMTNQTAVTVSKPTKFTAVFSSSTTVYKITIEKSLGTGVYATPNPLFGTFTTYNVGSGGTLRVSGSQLTITPSTGSFSYTVSYTAFGTGGTYTVYFTDSTGFTMSGTYTITSNKTITMKAKKSSFAAEQVDEDNGWQYDVEYVPLPWERGLKRNVCGFVEKI